MTQQDQTHQMNQGEELDFDRLLPWIARELPDLTGEPIVTQYSGGASNWTYSLQYKNRAIVLRRAPKGTKAKGAHDMLREYRLQKSIKPVYRYVPSMLAACDDSDVLGSDFYLMEKLNGIIPRRSLPSTVTLSEPQVSELCTNLIDSLIELHKVDYKAAGLEHLAKGEGFVERQVTGWIGRYQKVKTWNVPAANDVSGWLEKHCPSKETICLTHNDFRFDNVVLSQADPTQVIGVLDWELATLGDPLMELGNTLAYWIQADDDFIAQYMRRQPTHLKGMMTRKEVKDYYTHAMGIGADDFTFYEVFGLFRLAGIIQQIYYRYYHKQTQNKAFRTMWVMVCYLIYRCRKAIKQGGKA